MGMGGKLGTVAVLACWASSLLGDVKYRGIYVSDEDWGIRPWACRHYGDKEQLGARAYREIFDLMKEYGVNAIWPAMRPGGYEFVSRPANLRLAFEMNIAVGSTTGEPMMRNPFYLADKEKWDFASQSDFLLKYWDAAVSRYGSRDVLWTIGMAGARDVRKSGSTPAERIALQGKVIGAQMALLEKSKADRKDISTVYTLNNETLPLYEAGLSDVLPRETTVLWPDDGFGYVRRLGGPKNSHRGGVFCNVSNIGYPRSYSHVCTTPPAFLWWELVARAWSNGAGDVWMVDVGDVFQAEPLVASVGFYGRDPNGYGPAAQSRVLRTLIEKMLGYGEAPDRFVAHLTEAYTLGFIRRPEFMSVDWLHQLPAEMKRDLVARWTDLLREEKELEALLTPAQRDRYFRMFGYMVRYLAKTGLFFAKWENYTETNEKEAKAEAKSYIDALNARWDALEGGRWSGFFQNPATNEVDAAGASNPRNVMTWPWYGPCTDTTVYNPDEVIRWYAAGDYKSTKLAADGGAWNEVAGLGTSGRAMALLPAKPGAGEGAEILYEIDAGPNVSPDTRLILQFLPDYELWPSAGLGVRVSVNDGPPVNVRIPWSSVKVQARDYVRQFSVMDNFVRVPVNVRLTPEVNRIRILGWLPGVALDKIGIQYGGTPVKFLEPPPPPAPLGQMCGDRGPYANGCTGTPQSPKMLSNGLADFGRDAFGWLEIRGKGPYTLRVGEAAARGRVDFDQKAPCYAEEISGRARKDWTRVPLTPSQPAKDGLGLPAQLGAIRPFRYVEVPPGCEVRRMLIGWPMQSADSSFSCSDDMLTKVYEDARQAIIATSYAGYYMNGDLGRVPREEGVYLNLLGHYAVDYGPRLATRSLDLMTPKPEWSVTDRQVAILAAYEHYWHTGDAEDAKRRLPELKIGKVDTTGFKAVPMALTYRDLLAMGALSKAAGADAETVARYAEKAQTIRVAFNQMLWDTKEGAYRDGADSENHSVYANALAAALGLAEGSQLTRTGSWLAKQKPPCGTLGELFYLQALYRAARPRDANAQLATERVRGWGDTAPVNLIAREIMGVTVLEPGAEKLGVAPQPGNLKWMKGSVPTAKGPVRLDLQFEGRRLTGTLETPAPTLFSWSGRTEELPAGVHTLSY